VPPAEHVLGVVGLQEAVGESCGFVEGPPVSIEGMEMSRNSPLLGCPTREECLPGLKNLLRVGAIDAEGRPEA
jgi:hypothetical protein